MAQVEAAKVPIPTKDLPRRELYATVCFYYPQYKLQEAQSLPNRDLTLLIRTAEKREAVKMYNLTLIIAAPHSSKGKSVKTLLEHFKKAANR